jgi:hypothetical protein
MKKLILVSIFTCIISISGYGQIEKGNFLLGGGGSLNFSSEDENSDFDVNLSPTVGCFFTKKIALGVSMPLSFNYFTRKSYNSSQSFRGNIYGFGISPFLRYYFFQKKKVAFFGSASYGFNQEIYTSKNDDDNELYFFTNANASLGFVYFISQNIGLESTIGYNSYKNSDFETSNIKLNFGLQIYLKRKGKKKDE